MTHPIDTAGLDAAQIERVARAILASREARGDTHKSMYWQVAADTAWLSVANDAVAAIAATRPSVAVAPEREALVNLAHEMRR